MRADTPRTAATRTDRCFAELDRYVLAVVLHALIAAVRRKRVCAIDFWQANPLSDNALLGLSSVGGAISQSDQDDFVPSWRCNPHQIVSERVLKREDFLALLRSQTHLFHFIGAACRAEQQQKNAKWFPSLCHGRLKKIECSTYFEEAVGMPSCPPTERSSVEVENALVRRVWRASIVGFQSAVNTQELCRKGCFWPRLSPLEKARSLQERAWQATAVLAGSWSAVQW